MAGDKSSKPGQPLSTCNLLRRGGPSCPSHHPDTHIERVSAPRHLPRSQPSLLPCSFLGMKPSPPDTPGFESLSCPLVTSFTPGEPLSA